MDFEFLGPMIAWVVGCLTVGAVIFFSPLSKRICTLLEVMAQERRLLPGVESKRAEELSETINKRLALLEESQAFTEELLKAKDIPKDLEAGGRTAATGQGSTKGPETS